MNLLSVPISLPPDVNLVLGQSHFIKTVEDLYEALVTASPTIRFAVAFCESSGPALIRYDGNDRDLQEVAIDLAQKLSAGHCFLVLLKNAYPINVLQRIKHVEEVVSIFCATANPVEVILAETDQGRGILGVIDGIKTRGIETKDDVNQRHAFLRQLGYKR